MLQGLGESASEIRDNEGGIHGLAVQILLCGFSA